MDADNHEEIKNEHSATTWRRLKRKASGKHVKTGDRILAFDVGQIHMAQCILVVDTALRPPFRLDKYDTDWQILNLGSGKVSDSVHQLCKIVKAKKGEEWKAVDHVIIEQQARINVKMVALSHVLDSVIQMAGGPRAIFASSKSKFSIFSTMPTMSTLQPEPKGKSKYQQKKIRKQNAIDITRQMLLAMPDNGCALIKLRDTAKDQRDDLSDSFVYAAAYIYKHEPPTWL